MAVDRKTILEESWRRTLGTIETLLGRLAYLSSLRNANTGTYEHFGLAEKAGAGEADRLISPRASRYLSAMVMFQFGTPEGRTRGVFFQP